MELRLEKGSVLLATTDWSRWPVVPPLPSYPDTSERLAPFIGGSGIENSSIRGEGIIDGQGSGWWHMDGLTHGRPRLIEPMYCKNFTMVGVTVQNPPFWAMHPYVCDNVVFENITFSAPPNSPNTDGIDPDSCSNVVIRNFNVIHCGDDAVAIKSGKDAAGRAFGKPSYNILIEGGTIGPSSGIDIGSEMSGDVYNIMVRNLHFKEVMFASRIKSGRGRGGKVYNVTFEDITMDHAVMGLAISMLYASGGQRAPPTNETTPHIENISYRRITGTAGNAGAFLCLPESECRGIHLEDVNIDSFLGGFECIRAAGTTAGTVVPSACF